MGKCCGQGGGGADTAKGYSGAQGYGGATNRQTGGRRCVTDSHNEEVCHGTNERRRDLLDQLKIFLDDFDERPCQVTPPQTGPDAAKPLGQYPEYMKKHCQSWMPQNPRPPLITSVQAHEVRTTGDYEKMRSENSELVSYKDGRIKPPPSTCECAKRNGLQDQCPRPECTPPTPQCLATNPGPCCPPSMGLTGREAKAGVPAGQWQGNQRATAPQTTHQDYRSQQPPCGEDYQSTHRGDFTAQPGQRGYPPTSTHQQAGYARPAQGEQMICFCNASPSAMPKGKKYLCCPLPE